MSPASGSLEPVPLKVTFSGAAPAVGFAVATARVSELYVIVLRTGHLFDLRQDGVFSYYMYDYYFGHSLLRASYEYRVVSTEYRVTLSV